jgi:rsbT co-antagonist protein RsbR
MAQSDPVLDIRAIETEVDRIADQLAQAVGGDFDFTVHTDIDNGAVQKLCMMNNFLLGRIRTSLEEVRQSDERNQTLARQLEIIERQRQAIDELSTPILQIWDDILALPLIGVVDSQRSMDVMERLLTEIVARQASFVILDITGVDVVDTRTADHFIKVIKAAELLGTKCILTGIRPAVAQTLVEIGVDLSSVVTLRNIQEGLKECLRQREKMKSASAPRTAT